MLASLVVGNDERFIVVVAGMTAMGEHRCGQRRQQHQQHPVCEPTQRPVWAVHHGALNSEP